MSTPLLGRNARLYKDGVVIGYGKNISDKATAELIKEYSMDSFKPCIMAPGKQSFTWTAEKLYIKGEWMTLLLNGTKFDLVFAPTGSPTQAPYETWTDCVVLNVERTAGETGGVIERIEGEAEDVTVTDPS